jgi:hypothetical protein
MQSHRALRLVSPGAKSQYQPRSLCREPSIPGWHGKVTCGVKIDDQGHVRDVHVKGTTDESVVKRIRAALIKWGVRACHNQRAPVARIRSSKRGMT